MGTTQWHELSILSYAYPPATLTDVMFRPISQSGYGMELARFIWEQYAKGFPPTDMYICFRE